MINFNESHSKENKSFNRSSLFFLFISRTEILFHVYFSLEIMQDLILSYHAAFKIFIEMFQ